MDGPLFWVLMPALYKDTVVQPTNRVGTLGYDLVWRLSDAWQKTS